MKINESHWIKEKHAMALACSRATDANARDELILYLMPLVGQVMRKDLHIGNNHYYADECRSEGILGLVLAIDRFDQKKSKYVVTYTKTAIRRRMGRFYNKRLMLHMNTLGPKEFMKFYRLILKFVEETGRFPLMRDIKSPTCRKYSLKSRLSYFAAKENSKQKIPGDVPMEELLTVECTQRDTVMLRELQDMVDVFMDGLDPRGREILSRFINGSIMSDVAAELDISRERVRQIKDKVLGKLRNRLARAVS